MKQVLQNPQKKKPELVDVPPPQCGAGEVLVRTSASLISAGTEKMLMDFAGKSLVGKAQERPDLAKKVLNKLKRDGVVPTVKSVLAQLESPLPLGYSATGEILAVGRQVKGLKKGQRVAMAGAGYANHAEVNAVPQNLVVPLPDEVLAQEGAFCTLGAIALHGVRNAELTVGDRVLVLGLGLVGQLVSQLATLSGAQVMGMDFDESRMALTKETGGCAETISPKKAQTAVETFMQGRGFDAVLICAATESNAPLEQAVQWARDRGRIVLVGKVGTELPYAEVMKKELTVKISRSYGPGRYDANFEEKGQTYPIGYVPHTERDNLAHVVRLIGERKLKIEPLISHIFDIAEADQAYALIGAHVPCMGVVLTYPEQQRVTSRIDFQTLDADADVLGVAAIGAGGFAKSVLLPALKPLMKEFVHLTGVVSKGGVSATSTAQRSGFAFASGEVADVFDHDGTDLVLITTRHDSHAALVQAALKAGKHVFVEKPLGLSLDEIDAVEKAWKKAPKQQLLIGYNRRFAPMTQRLMALLPDPAQAPRQILIRVNAGQLPEENWQHDQTVGGGRLLGEVCHFTDLALALAGDAVVTDIQAKQGEGQDNYSISLSFENGAQAQIFYTSEGDSSVSKERIEVFAGGCVGVIDNFTTGFFSQHGRSRPLGHWQNWPGLNLVFGQDKGHQAELAGLVAAIQTGEAVVAPAALLQSARLPFLIQEAL